MKRKKTAKASENPSFANPEIGQIEQLLRFMTEHNLEEFEYSHGDLRIRLKKPAAGLAAGSGRASWPEIIVPGAVPAPAATQAAALQNVEPRAGDDLHLIKSPIVGTFYGSPSPGSEPFVKVGAYVEEGQTLCIEEAMKKM